MQVFGVPMPLQGSSSGKEKCIPLNIGGSKTLEDGDPVLPAVNEEAPLPPCDIPVVGGIERRRFPVTQDAAQLLTQKPAAKYFDSFFKPKQQVPLSDCGGVFKKVFDGLAKNKANGEDVGSVDGVTIQVKNDV